MRTQAEFSLGRRDIPWWAASVSFAAGEISALTLVGLPGSSFRDGWTLAQVLIGSTAARLIVAFALLPLIFNESSPSVYGFLREKIGPRTHAAAASLFMATRLLSGAARLMAGGVAAAVLAGCPLWVALLVLAGVAAVALAWGGVRAVVWLGVAQAVVVAAAACGAIAYLTAHIDGGLAGIWQLAQQHGRLEIFRLSPVGGRFFDDPRLLWACALSGLFGGTAIFGADQEMTQRLRCARGLRDAQLALLASAIWGGLIVALYLFLGSGLFAFYRTYPGVSFPARYEHLYPQFAATALPPALRLLVLASVGLVALDLPIVGMATVFVSDAYRPLRPRLGEAHYLAVARLAAVFFAFWIVSLAWIFARAAEPLRVALDFSAITVGPLAAAFVAAARFRSPSDRATAGAMGAMAAVCAALLALSIRGSIALTPMWLVVYGAVGAIGLAWGLGPSFEGQ